MGNEDPPIARSLDSAARYVDRYAIRRVNRYDKCTSVEMNSWRECRSRSEERSTSCWILGDKPLWWFHLYRRLPFVCEFPVTEGLFSVR